VTIPARSRLGEGGSAAGIDPSPEMIAIARRKAQLHHRHAQFSAKDLSWLLQEADFETIEQPGVRFLTIGFVRAKKPASF
jgi:hypothetical protein